MHNTIRCSKPLQAVHQIIGNLQVKKANFIAIRLVIAHADDGD